LSLTDVYVLPVMIYALDDASFSQYEGELSVCWNNLFRRIFNGGCSRRIVRKSDNLSGLGLGLG